MPANHSKAKVLIADDDAMMREMLKMSLERFDFELFCAEDGLKAKELFSQINPDIVLLDIDMPELDGYETCGQMRFIAGQNYVPIVMVTGKDDRESIERAFDMGADDFMVKPLNWALLGHQLKFIMRSCSAIQEVVQHENRQRALLEALPDACLICSENGEVQSVHLGKLYFVFPYLKDAVGSSISETFNGALRSNIAEQIILSTELKRVPSFQSRVTLVNGENVYIESRLVISEDSEIIVFLRDITDIKEHELKLSNIALYDPLTKLPNRLLIEKELASLVASATAIEQSLAVMFIHLDQLSRINDHFGLCAGDEVLNETSKRLAQLAESINTDAQSPLSIELVGRFAGNDFVFIVRFAGDLAPVKRLTEKIGALLDKPFKIDSIPVFLRFSIGVACCPQHTNSAVEIIELADSALRIAKGRQGQKVTLFSEDIRSKAKLHLKIDSYLRHAIEKDELELVLQRKHSLTNHDVVTAEALLRWNCKALGPISPAQFIPIAEETGLILPISEWVIEQACKLCRSLLDQFDQEFRIAINLSPQQFEYQSDLIQFLEVTIERYQLSPANIELEITEYVLLSDIEETIKKLDTLHEKGFTIAIDDFGTGYSSLSYLTRFKIDTLKIDRAFISTLDDPKSQKLVNALILLGHSLGMKIVAEGVELEHQLDFLTELQCDFIQGFLLSKPRNFADFCHHLNDD